MAFNNPSPGSYSREVDASQYAQLDNTTVGVIVGMSKRGPLMQRTLVTDKKEFVEIFGKPDFNYSLAHYAALEFLGKANNLYFTRVVNTEDVPLTAGAFYVVDDLTATTDPVGNLHVFDNSDENPVVVSPKGLHDPFNTYTWNPNMKGIENMQFMICAENPGTWNDSLYVEIVPSTKAGLTHADYDPRYDDSSIFFVDVYENYSSPRQTPKESHKVTLTHRTDGYGAQLYIEDVINQSSNLIRVRVNEFAKVMPVTRIARVFLSGGTNGGDDIKLATMKAGWDLYKDREVARGNLFIQGGTPLAMTDLNKVAELQRYMLSIAEDRVGTFCVLDMPSKKQEVSDAVAYRTEVLNTDSNFGAIYTPDCKILDTYNDKHIWVPPSGFVAAKIAESDRNYALWYAAAGMTRGSLSIEESRFLYNKGKRDVFEDYQINPIRFFPDGSGYKIWGADTLQVEKSALTNIPVRRLLSAIRVAVDEATIYRTFDLNSSILRTRVKAIVNSLLQPIQDAEGLYWFEVVCDERNNTPATIAAGDLILDVYLDPAITTKRIHLNAYIIKTGANYKEYITNRN